MNLSEDGGNSRNGLVSKPNILGRIRGRCSSFYWGILDVDWKQTGEETFFRRSYNDEIRIILNFYPRDHNNEVSDHVIDGFLGSLFRNSVLRKRFLQHLYSCEKTTRLFSIIKQIACEHEQYKRNNHYDTAERNKLVKQFRKEFEPIYDNLKNSAFPNFGICDECITDFRKLNVTRKSRKILEDTNSKEWDLFSD